MKRVVPALFVLAMMSSAASAQQSGDSPPSGQGQQPQLPDVEVIQEPQPQQAAPAAKPKPKPKPVAAQAKPKPKPQPVQQPEFPEPVEPVEAAPEELLDNSPYGSPAAAGAASRAQQSAQTPVNPTQLVPDNLDGFASAATKLSSESLKANRPPNINEALTRVPGVVVINDDASAHHGGIGIRGAPARRSRKLLVMEDGHTVNLALWLDPSVHYWGPIERYEDVEVIRGTIITHGPNNNFGVINARNLSPFGPDETVVSGAIGFTKTKRGTYTGELEFEGGELEPEEDFEPVTKGDSTDLSYRWHVHTRQSSDNVGVVASYTGSNVQGLWDSEQLRFHDFYGAVGWKGSSSDLVVSSMYARQRDDYDEQNFLGEAGLPDAGGDQETAEAQAEEIAGFAENQFNLLKHCKTCFAPAAGLNNYNGEIWRGQIVHNAYLDNDTTVTSRVYAGYHRRDRYQLNSYESDPNGDGGAGAYFVDSTLIDDEAPDGEQTVVFGENSMFGRLRTFRHVGAEVRAEWANRDILGFNQDIQAGIRYEYQDMTNRNFIGAENEVLKNGDESGATIFDRELDANTVSAFLQTNVKVASNFNVVPGIRFEWYGVDRVNRVVAREESEASGLEDEDLCERFDDEECLSVDGIIRDPDPATESFNNFAALPGVAFAYTGLYRTTVFGGYHRGLTTQVLRNEDFPGKEEIGDNFNLGIRSSAIKGFDYEVAGFYHMIKDYQFGASFSNVAGDRSFGIADEVEIGGVELAGRLNSRPFTGGPYNFFTQGNYTYSRGKFTDLRIEDEDSPDGFAVFDGNRIPESPLHVAAITIGVEKHTGWRWDLSATWTYRGAFFTDEGNTRFGFGGEVECEDGECEVEEAGEDGEVPSVWLLSARFNLDIGDTGASIFVSGDNLLDEFYISDREDGMKPGLGRTIWTGFKYKF